MPHRRLFHNVVVYSRAGLIGDGWLLVEDARIADLGSGEAPRGALDEMIDGRGLILAPGLIDIHVHGALGYDTMDATPQALREIARFGAEHGVTAFLATTMTGPSDAIMAALRNIDEVREAGTGGAALLGAHVEGPFLDAERAGAQDPSLVRTASPDEYVAMLDTGVVRLITVAPEYTENHPLIRYAVERGAVASVGHTRASYEDLQYATSVGITQVTHLYNAMEPMHHRTPGALGAALTLQGLRCQLIADNVHVHPAMLDLAVRAKSPEGIILVTDAMSGTGMADGVYDLGGQAVTVSEGIARIGGGALAGSTLTMDRAVRNVMGAADLALWQALTMATSTPAASLGIARKGEIAVGSDADLILIDPQMNVALTMVEGHIVHDSSGLVRT